MACDGTVSTGITFADDVAEAIKDVRNDATDTDWYVTRGRPAVPHAHTHTHTYMRANVERHMRDL
jgi:ribosomal protein S5